MGAIPSRLFWLRIFSIAKQVGGGGRTRTFEVIRRLIYSQLPLPLGTLPLSTASQPNRRDGRDKGNRMTLKPRTRSTGSRSGAFMGEAPRQSQPTEAADMRRDGLKLPL